jgi:predicted transcriptional regulator
MNVALISNSYQIAGFSLLVIALYFAETQINEIRKVKKEEKEIAITALIEELKHNKRLLEGYIKNCTEGGHIKSDSGVITYELTKPIFMAYEKYLILACKSNLDIIAQINFLYNKLEAIKVIIEINQNIAVSNMGGILTAGSIISAKAEISKNNSELLKNSNDAYGKIKDMIDALSIILEAKRPKSEHKYSI